MLDGSWRSVVDRGLIPIGRSLHRAGVTADVVTTIGIVMAAASAFAIGLGYLRLGLVLLVFAGIPDALDGPVAKAAGSVSPRGAFFDSVSDRITDALLLGGVSWYLVETEPGHLVMLPVAVLVVSLLISYQRAKAESLGLDAKGGLMERAERVVVLAFGLLFSEALVVVLWVMLVLSVITAGQRFVKVWRQASSEDESPYKRRRARRRQLRFDRSRRGVSRRQIADRRFR